MYKTVTLLSVSISPHVSDITLYNVMTPSTPSHLHTSSRLLVKSNTRKPCGSPITTQPTYRELGVSTYGPLTAGVASPIMYAGSFLGCLQFMTSAKLHLYLLGLYRRRDGRIPKSVWQTIVIYSWAVAKLYSQMQGPSNILVTACFWYWTTLYCNYYWHRFKTAKMLFHPHATWKIVFYNHSCIQLLLCRLRVINLFPDRFFVVALHNCVPTVVALHNSVPTIAAPRNCSNRAHYCFGRFINFVNFIFTFSFVSLHFADYG